MALTTTVTPAMVHVELGRPSPTTEEATRLQSWIDQALYLINKRFPDGGPVQADVDYVVLMAVAEHARNPESATQVDVSIDDGSVSKRYTSGSGRVSIWDELWAYLDDYPGDAGAFSIQPFGEPDATTTAWL